MNYAELQQAVIEKGFSRSIVGTAATGEQVIFSAGIGTAYNFTDPDIQTAITSFINGDFGSFYDWDETPTPGSEYGEYKSIFGQTAYTGAIMIHREKSALVLYFQFER